MLEGFRLQAPSLPETLVRDGQRLQFELGAPALRLSRNVYAPSWNEFHAIPYGASLRSGSRAVYTSGQPGALVLDDGRKWPVSCPDIVTENRSSLVAIPSSEYFSIPTGPNLYCLQ